MSIKAIPLLIFSLILYFAILAFGSAETPAYQVFQGEPFGGIPLPLGGEWILTWGDILLIITIALLGMEVVKATYTRGSGLADQALSMVLFVVLLVMFLLVRSAGTSVFFLITLCSFVDVVAGAIIGIRTARRDIGFGATDA